MQERGGVNMSNYTDLTTFHGTWKILSPEGRFLMYATGSMTQAIMCAKENGILNCQIVPSERDF